MKFKTGKQRARELALQSIYQWLISNDDISEIEKQFLEREKSKFSKYFFSNLITNIPKNIELLNDLIKPYLDRDLEELGNVEHAILYIAAYEMKFNIEIAYKVIINEAIEMAKNFGAEGSYKMINTVLDKLAMDLRKIEVKN